MVKRDSRTLRAARLRRIGWTLLAAAILAIAGPVIATAAQPHVVWLFTLSYGSIGLVLGATLLRVGSSGDQATRRGRGLGQVPIA